MRLEFGGCCDFRGDYGREEGEIFYFLSLRLNLILISGIKSIFFKSLESRKTKTRR